MRVEVRELSGVKSIFEYDEDKRIVDLCGKEEFMIFLHRGSPVGEECTLGSLAVDHQSDVLHLYSMPAPAGDVESTSPPPLLNAHLTRVNEWLSSTQVQLLNGGNDALALQFDNISCRFEKLSKEVPVAATENAPPRPAAAAPPAANWLSLGLVLRVCVSLFFMMQNPSNARILSLSLALTLHVLEVTGLGYMLLGACKAALTALLGRTPLLDSMTHLEAWITAGCAVPPTVPEEPPGLIREVLYFFQGLLFSLVPQWTADGLGPIT